MGEKLNDGAAASASAGAATAIPGGTSTAPGGGTGTEPAPTSGQGSGGGQQADQSGPSDPDNAYRFPTEAEVEEVKREWGETWRASATDDELREAADSYDETAETYQREVYDEIGGANDPALVDYTRRLIDDYREASREARQELHERELARGTGGGGAEK